MGKKLFTLLVFIVFIIPIINQANAYTENNNSREGIDGYRIKIDSPSIVLDCFSFFYLVKIRKAGIRGLFFGMLWKKYFDIFTKDISTFLSSTIPPIKMINHIILSKLLMDYKMWKEIYNPFITWEKVNVSFPFVSSDKIKFSVVDHSTETNNKGEFYVIVKIENQLEHNITCGVLVDVSSEPFINSLFPTAKVTRYNAGFLNIPIPAGQDVVRKINCSFPPGGFIRKNYTVRVECGSYIPIRNSNQIGIYTYSIRWLGFIKPYYRVNATVQEAIKRFWYNLPIFGKGGTAEFLPTEQFNIEYKGEESFSVEKAIEKTSNELKKLLLLTFISVFILILMTLFVYKKILEK